MVRNSEESTYENGTKLGWIEENVNIKSMVDWRDESKAS